VISIPPNIVSFSQSVDEGMIETLKKNLVTDFNNVQKSLKKVGKCKRKLEGNETVRLCLTGCSILGEYRAQTLAL
jgi:hypothetical protein